MAVDTLTQITSGFPAIVGDDQRLIVRDSNGNIIACLPQDANENAFFFISSDGGSTWTQGGTSLEGENFASRIHIDQNDVIHYTTSNRTQTANLYSQFTIATDGTMNMLVSEESIDTVNQGSTWGAYSVVASDGTVYAITQRDAKVMGTFYQHCFLYERTSSGWNQLSNFSSGQNSADIQAFAIDGNDDLHIGYDQLHYRKYDTSAGTMGAEEDLGNISSSHTSLIIDSSNIPVFTHWEYVHKRTSGTWTRDRFSNDQEGAKLTEFNGELVVLYHKNNGDIWWNHATFGSFDPADEEILIEGTASEDFTDTSPRWQFLNDNEPSTETLEFVINDSDSMWYAAKIVSVAGGVLDTDASGVVQTDASGVIQTTN